MLHGWEDIYQNYPTHPTTLKKSYISRGGWPPLCSLMGLSPGSSSHRFPRAAGLSLEFTQIPLFSNFHLVSLIWGLSGDRGQWILKLSFQPSGWPACGPHRRDASLVGVASMQGKPLCPQIDTTQLYLLTQASHFKTRDSKNWRGWGLSYRQQLGKEGLTHPSLQTGNQDSARLNKWSKVTGSRALALSTAPRGLCCSVFMRPNHGTLPGMACWAIFP